MADLRDNIRLNTTVDLEALNALILKYKELGVGVSSVAAAARAAAEIQKSELRAIVAAEEAAEIRRQGNSDRRRQNKVANIKLETQAELDAIRIADAEDKSRTQSAIRNTQLRTAELRKEALETRLATQANTGLSSSLAALSGLRSQLIGLFGVMSVGSFAKEMVDAQSQVESFQLSMKNLLGAEYGGKLVADLKQFTVNTPLNFEEVIKATNTLVGSFKAAGASSKTIGTEIPQILDSLGNSAAALGGQDRLGRLIYAFSQVQATGRLMGTEVRQITETGFPLLAVMSQTTGKSVQELQKDITDGKVSFEQFKTAILSAGKEGGVFAGSMDIMANTVRGRIDKMKESVFFALANIGDQFNDSAKKAIDFGSNVVQALFGTESAAKRTIELLRTAIITWGAYTVATRIAASQTVINTAIDRASLILRGQMTLATISLTGSTESLTFAQLRAAAAARSFNAVAITNPLGLLALGVGAVVGAYQLYNSSVEQAEEKQKKLTNEISTALAPIQRQKQEFNNLANAVLATNIPIAEQEKALNKLKEQHPILLKGVTDLATAEDILNKNKIKTNTTLDFRNARFEELKKKYPEQLKGIDTLAEAEAKLGGIVRLTNRDFAILSATMENNIRIQTQVAGANENFAKKIQAQADLARLRAGQTGANLVDFGGNVISNTPALIAAKEKEIAAYDKAAKEFVKASEVIRAKNEELTGKLKYSWEEIPKTIDKTGKEGKEKALKYQKDTNEQIKIASEKIFAEDLEDSRQKDLILRNLEYRNQQERIKNAIGSQKTKNKLLLDLEQDYDADISKIHQTWDERDRKLAIKAEKERNDGIAAEAKRGAEAMWKVIEKRNNDERREKEKLSKDIIKIDQDNAEESAKITEKQYILVSKIRLLNKISHAKTADEIVEIEKEEKAKTLEAIRDFIKKELDYAKLRLDYIKTINGEQSLEYKKAYNAVLKLESDYIDASIDAERAKTEKLKLEIKNREDNLKQSFKIIYEAGKDILDTIFSIKSEKLSQELQSAETELDRFRIRQQQKDLDTEKKTIGFFTALASGNWVQAIGNLVSVIGDLSTNVALERQAALLEDQLNSLKEIMGIIDSSLNSIGSSFESISEVYGAIFDVSKLQEFSVLAETSIEDRIQAEIKHGEQITANYNKAVKEEGDRYNKQIDNINKAFDLEVKNINAKYDLIDLKAKQAYNVETLAITAAGSAQLEALIKNEESLSSVRAEFAQKRIDIENAFPLASRAITEGMTQAEIDAINASIDARDKALAKLQGWYNQELIAIANAEGQKRKEYSETEKIQNEINDRLELAAIKFQGNEIQREKDKADAIVVAEQNKNLAIQGETAKHNQVLVNLELQKNADILNSFTTLKILLQAQINQITGALVDSANISAEAFARLKQQLEEITNLYRALSNGTTPPTIVIPTIDIPRIGGFEKGTDNTSVSLTGATVDNRGGKLAVLHPDEAIFSKADMTEMTRFFGKRPTRDEVIDRFKMGTKLIDSNSFIQKISPYVINKSEGNVNIDLQGLRSDLSKLTREVVKRQQPIVNIDKNGIRTYLTNINSQIEIKNQKFSS